MPAQTDRAVAAQYSQLIVITPSAAAPVVDLLDAAI
jgi:hypothetical protein